MKQAAITFSLALLAVLPFVSRCDEPAHPFMPWLTVQTLSGEAKNIFLIQTKASGVYWQQLYCAMPVRPPRLTGDSKVVEFTPTVRIWPPSKRLGLRWHAPTASTLEDCAKRYQEVIDRQAGRATPVPYRMIGPVPFHFDGDDSPGLHEAADKYMENPSSLEAVAYVELSLVYFHLAKMDLARSTLTEAIDSLSLKTRDFSMDVEFRKIAPRNVARPECAILYLAGIMAEIQGDLDVAYSHFEVLIRQAPASPFSTEGLARLVKAESDIDLKSLAVSILDQAPLIWGHNWGHNWGPKYAEALDVMQQDYQIFLSALRKCEPCPLVQYERRE